ncbi:DivIVA domain-containing protein [Streptococcus oralis]|jgi:cell division initiation protein|uniref:DivIVA domain-containing protein n=1 Tax=Streptococcus oralis TaxID=1303 RepID=UPI00066E57F9|nr:DivIVA domain-containing protein [Streptococcus oralis]MCP9125794.1 DivIVA domain-containing protein [Streptococcus oralis]MCY7086568.1 DivIVA domain-containing protein [Streptococcus oralis]MCY7098466.1 DivIVA domain-containing protein [Streptococcus oralis]MDK7171529.1 DivIVA domain-containing protein [Streptococcus oralis]MDK8112738.1 DivIVA domain-containing protein [Streptococcus oralis]
MSITPQEISDKAFSRTFRGYNQEEVDLFLDMIYFELEEMIRYKDETELYIKKLEERLSYYTNDIPKRTVTSEQEPEAINDSIFY